MGALKDVAGAEKRLSIFKFRYAYADWGCSHGCSEWCISLRKDRANLKHKIELLEVQLAKEDA